jgi:putative DNA primase/helicase
VTGERLVGTPPELESRQAEVPALYATLAREAPELLPAAARPRPTLAHSDAEVVAKALAAANGATFQALWLGDLHAYTDPRTGQVDQSRADFALCLLLAYWCNSDPDQMDRLFRQSALYRLKGEAQTSGGGHSYGQVTIWNAIRRHEQSKVSGPVRRNR